VQKLQWNLSVIYFHTALLIQPLLMLLQHLLKISSFSHKQTCRLMRYSLIALSMIFCSMSYQKNAVLVENKELSWQLTSGTHICELVGSLNKDTLSKFCNNVNKWLNTCGALAWWDFTVISAYLVSFSNILQITR